MKKLPLFGRGISPCAVLLAIIFVLSAMPMVATVEASDVYPTLQYDAQRTGNVSGAAPETATLLWQSNEKTAGCIQAGPIISDGNVYVSTWWSSGMGVDGNAVDALYCLDEASGREIWNNTGVNGASTAALADNKLFVGTHIGNIACVDATSGALLWSKKIEENPSWYGVTSSPLVFDDTVYVLSFSDGTLHAFSFDGTELWNFSSGGEIFCYSSPSAYGNKIFFAGNDSGQRALYCFDLNTQAEVWNFTTETEIRGTPTIWSEEGMVFFTTKYIPTKEYGIYAVNITTGDRVWHKQHKSSWASPALSNGKLYIGGSAVDTTFYCYDARDCSLIWENEEMGGAIESSPVVANGKVYFGTNEVDGTVYALDANNGSTLWSYTLYIPPDFGGGFNIATQPAVSDCTLFIGVDNVGVLAFRDFKFWDFDTDAPGNPYPSISGRHYGNITLSHDVYVTSLFTRACAGTGGHTEYVKIWNDTWNGVDGVWHGYTGNWHTIPFDEAFMLTEGETYYYLIDTGSYPHIHHKSVLNVSDGTITCTNFTDANGKIYNDWIPAIRLE